MIELYDVKKYNTYNYVQDTLPTLDGTWLCSLTDSGFVRGYSYQVTSSVATRIEILQDELITEKTHPTLSNVLTWINNPFYVSRALQEQTTFTRNFDDDYFFPISLSRKWQAYESDTGKYTFTGGVISGVTEGTFIVGDLINIEGALRNNLFGYVTAISGEDVTIDNPNAVDTEENAVIFLSDIPKMAELIVAQMIHWDVYNRELSDKNSESIGNYSYNKGTVTIGGLDYPSSLVAQLNVYRRVDFVA